MWWSRSLSGIMRAGRVGDDGRQVCLGMSMDRDANVGSYLRSKALLTVEREGCRPRVLVQRRGGCDVMAEKAAWESRLLLQVLK